MSSKEPDFKRKKMNKTHKSLQESPGITDLPSAQELEEMFHLRIPDPFADSSSGGEKMSEQTDNEGDELQEVLSMEATRDSPAFEEGEGESSTASNEVPAFMPWKGCFLTELQKGRHSCGMPQLHPIKPSSNHTVMFQMGSVKKEGPTDAWDNNHVRMPCSPQNKYPVENNLKSRWDMVKSALQNPIKNVQELEDAIMSYNNKYFGRWDFSGLHYFFSEAIEEEETLFFFSDLLPQISELALQLPALITWPLPLLRKGQNHSISLTQQQVACLLANAFFCTFPRRNAARKASEYSTFPDINFNRLFQGQKRKPSLQRTSEKLKCLFHYFRRVCCSRPKGNITFTRRHIAPGSFPAWDSSGHFFRKLHITSHGTIEDCGKGMLQVDFAHKLVGGGVLGWGCVQEEIRFVICPELIIARLFTECLEATEALLITGCEQYSIYEGYADNFTWAGDYLDKTPHDSSARKLCSVVAIDALYLRYPAQQFIVTNLLREINKAYVGFYNQEINPEHLSSVATGNWGCGVYRGNTRLKALLQLMAATQAGRGLAYFTFGDDELRDDVVLLHKFLVEHKATVGLVWRHLCRYYDQCYRSGTFNQELYDYLCKAIDPTNHKKGRYTAVQSASRISTYSQSEKSKQPESHDKRNENKNKKVTSAASRETLDEPRDKAHSSTGSANLGSTAGASAETKSVTASTDLTVVSRESKKSVKSLSSTPRDKFRPQQHLVKKIWERKSMSSHSWGLQQQLKSRGPSSLGNISSAKNFSPTRSLNPTTSTTPTSPTRSVRATSSLNPTSPTSPTRSVRATSSFNPTRSLSPTKCNSPSKSPNLPRSASLESAVENDIGGNECGSSGIHDVRGSWSEQYEKPLTIQKRISDYFYEINVPK